MSHATLRTAAAQVDKVGVLGRCFDTRDESRIRGMIGDFEATKVERANTRVCTMVSTSFRARQGEREDLQGQIWVGRGADQHLPPSQRLRTGTHIFVGLLLDLGDVGVQIRRVVDACRELEELVLIVSDLEGNVEGLLVVGRHAVSSICWG